MKRLRASVIIPSRGRDECLRQTLRDLDSQEVEHGRFDVWVVDQNDEPLQNLAGELSSVKFHHEKMEPLGSHAGRNHAIFKTDADICIFVDDDVRVSPHFVGAHLEAHETYAREMNVVACVAGRVIQPKDGLTESDMIQQGRLARYHAFTGRVTGNFVGHDVGFVDHIHECNFSARTGSLRKIGGFNEEFRGNAYFEGTDLALRLQKAGFKILYRPEIVLTHLQDGRGGNRVQEKSQHTYWFLRNLGLLNSIHMRRLGIPLYGAYGLYYALGKAAKNVDPGIALQGLRGLKDGLSYFIHRNSRLKLRR